MKCFFAIFILLKVVTSHGQQIIKTVTGAGDTVRTTVAALTGIAPTVNPAFSGTFAVPNGVITNSMLSGSIDLATKVTGILPFASNAGSSAATSATTGTISVAMTTRLITCTPSGALTLNATNGVVGQTVTMIFTTSGTSSFNITFNTNYKSQGVLATGTVTAKVFCVTFVCTAATPTWTEISRTIAM